MVELGLYASDGYLARQGVPDSAGGAPGHLFIGMSEGIGNIAEPEWLPRLVGNARVVARVNGPGAMARMAAAGIGICCLPRFLGDADRDLRLLATPRPGRAASSGLASTARPGPRVG